jgi:hypothetical protein
MMTDIKVGEILKGILSPKGGGIFYYPVLIPSYLLKQEIIPVCIPK